MKTSQRRLNKDLTVSKRGNHMATQGGRGGSWESSRQRKQQMQRPCIGNMLCRGGPVWDGGGEAGFGGPRMPAKGLSLLLWPSWEAAGVLSRGVIWTALALKAYCDCCALRADDKVAQAKARRRLRGSYNNPGVGREYLSTYGVSNVLWAILFYFSVFSPPPAMIQILHRRERERLMTFYLFFSPYW